MVGRMTPAITEGGMCHGTDVDGSGDPALSGCVAEGDARPFLVARGDECLLLGSVLDESIPDAGKNLNGAGGIVFELAAQPPYGAQQFLLVQ